MLGSSRLNSLWLVGCLWCAKCIDSPKRGQLSTALPKLNLIMQLFSYKARTEFTLESATLKRTCLPFPSTLKAAKKFKYVYISDHKTNYPDLSQNDPSIPISFRYTSEYKTIPNVRGIYIYGEPCFSQWADPKIICKSYIDIPWVHQL